MKTLILHPEFKSKTSAIDRDPEGRLEEAVRLAHAIDLPVVDQRVVNLPKITPATLFGSGKVEEIAEWVKAGEIQLAVVNAKVSPVQQRNLEKAWNCKVIDRTALILEIFGARARTHEGKLQVELASLNYQKSRLVRSWTHLERQRGGFGFLGGPGESQIEIDRRLIRDRIAKIRRELENVVRTRELHRKNRRDVPYPIVALVGYTNAGKSTLFNRLTGANVLSMDKLFATLDPTLRMLKLPSGYKVILSDTVGFVSDLPHELVAAFRATLEEVIEADLILHVRDISHEESEAQKADVLEVLAGLLPEEDLEAHMIEVWNKVDKLADSYTLPGDGHIRISALTGQGIEELMEEVEEHLSHQLLATEKITLPLSDGKTLAWLHAHGSIMEQEVVEDNLMDLTVRLTHENLARLKKMLKKQ